MRKLLGIASAAALLATVAAAPADAKNVTEGQYVYAVKYVCGSVLPRFGARIPDAYYEAVVPGWYSTVINIHNPNGNTISMEYEANTTHGDPNGRYDVKGGVEEWPTEVALEYDCRDFYVLDHFDYAANDPDRFVKGIWYIYSTYPIDVIAVYTAAPFVLDQEICGSGCGDKPSGRWAGGWTPGVSSMQVLPIEGRKIGGGNGYVKQERY